MNFLRARSRQGRRTVEGLLAGAIALLLARSAEAQDPSRAYYTIATPHFRVSFTRAMEPLARRVAADAERAYGQLSVELHPPRGMIDVLVSDDADYSNGSAITYPTNRIVVYATPPINDMALRYTTDWAQLVVTHELTHIFHLDRSRGIWRLGQYVFGRSPFLFPNLYQPSWLIEGLAVYEESRLAGQGRIEGSEHALIARAAAIDHLFPSIGQASLAYPRFPLGESAYAYGSLFFDYLARTKGRDNVRKFVEASSAQVIPYLIDIPARSAFGTGFSGAWNEWRRSIEASLPSDAGAPLPGWKDLTTDGLVASFPRWLADSTLTYTGTGGRESYAAFTISLDGRRKRLSRRNGASPTVRLPDGSLLFAQFDYTSPYEYRSDLFVERDGGQHRLTKNQRLFEPDTRADGAIIATQIVDGASRIVRVASDGHVVEPITGGSFDTLWSEPRWSRAGTHVVAVRWLRGGISQIVIIDTLGRNVSVVASGRFVAAAPSWLPGDTAVIYTIGERGANDAYITGLGAPTTTARVTRSSSGFFEPVVSTGRSPALVAGLTLRGNGYRLGAGSCCATDSLVPTPRDTTPDPRLPSLGVDSAPASRYSAWHQMVPRYWVPLVEAGLDADTYRIGGYTEVSDILRRHYAYGDVRIPTDNSGLVGSIQYQYKGLGLPVISVNAIQDWTRYASVYSRSSPAVKLGTVRRRIRDAELLATYLRPRQRSSFNASVGVGLERREYATRPATLLPMIDSGGIFAPANFPRLTASAGYARYQTPPFAISPEDGFSLAFTARERLRSGFNASGTSSLSLVGSSAAYKSLNLPGFAHHVLAVRAAGGWADTRANGYYEIGGISGSAFEIVPGHTVGEGRKNFPVRGFAPGTAVGIRAMSGSAEYRAPLSLTQRTLGTLPTFLQRSALTLFGDYGIGWCPSAATTRQVCTDPAQTVRTDMASVGGELSVNAGVLSWDHPYRFRLGVAKPIHNGAALKAKSLTVYFTSGVSF